MKKVYIFLVSWVLPFVVWSQTVATETFEDETGGAVSFTSNGQIFNITSQQSNFDIYNDLPGLGWNGTAPDNKFIDNSGQTDFKQTVEFTIASEGVVPFTLKSMWMFYSHKDLTPGQGTITITGRRSGTDVFSVTETLSTVNQSQQNGYSKFDLSSYGAQDNANKVIDAFVISTSGDFEYIALDALTWATVDIAAPVQLKNFSGYVQKGTAHFRWNTGVETQFDHFELEKSAENNKFSTIEKFVAKGNNSDYAFNVFQAEPSAQYRLKMVDKSGTIHYSRQITLSENGEGKTGIYPNPAHDYINVRVTEAASIQIYDALGRQVKKAYLERGVNSIDISGLSAGVYYARVGKEKISFVKN